MRLIITRPDPDGERTAAKLRARGCEVLLAPLLTVELVAAELGPGPWDALIVTSSNALRAIEQHPQREELTHLPVLAVGARTAEASRALGFKDVISAEGSAQDLIRLARMRYRGGPAHLLYLAGDERSADFARALASDGIDVRTVVVYRAVKATRFPTALAEALEEGRVDGVLHFSRRSAEAYLDCAKASRSRRRALAPTHYCLSGQVAEPLVTAGAAAVRIARRPEEAALIELIA